MLIWYYAGPQYDPGALYRLGGVYEDAGQGPFASVYQSANGSYRVLEVKPASGEFAGFLACARELFDIYRGAVAGADVTAAAPDADGHVRLEHGAWLLAGEGMPNSAVVTPSAPWVRLDFHPRGAHAPGGGGPVAGGAACFAHFACVARGEDIGWWSVALAKPFLPADRLVHFFEMARRRLLTDFDRESLRNTLTQHLG